jgi:Na+-transporting methylmalonyl-CoA/oxaloacetate decarboxylase gamma subunit
MKVLWTIVKVALAMVLIIPVSLLLLGVVGTVLGLAVMLLRLAILGLLIYFAFKLVGRLFRGPAPRVEQKEIPSLASGDRYYQAALRELDREIPEARSRP